MWLPHDRQGARAGASRAEGLGTLSRGPIAGGSRTSQRRVLQGRSPAGPQHPPLRRRHSAQAEHTPRSRPPPRLQPPACNAPPACKAPSRAGHAGSGSPAPPLPCAASLTHARSDADAIFFLLPPPIHPPPPPHRPPPIPTPSSRLRGEVGWHAGSRGEPPGPWARTCSSEGTGATYPGGRSPLPSPLPRRFTAAALAPPRLMWRPRKWRAGGCGGEGAGRRGEGSGGGAERSGAARALAGGGGASSMGRGGAGGARCGGATRR